LDWPGLAPFFPVSFFHAFGDTYGDAYTQFVQQYKGQSDDGLTHPVGGRGDDCRDKEDRDVGVFPVGPEKTGCDEADGGQYIADQGQLKGQTRADDDVNKVLYIVVQCRDRPDPPGGTNGVVIQEAEGKGGQQEIAEGNPRQKEEADPKDGATAAFQLFCGERGLDEAPELPENIREGNDEAADDGDIDTGNELGAELGGLERMVLGGLEVEGVADVHRVSVVADADVADEVIADRAPDDHIEDPVHLDKEYNGDNDNGKSRTDNMPAQSLQVVYERHFLLARIPV